MPDSRATAQWEGNLANGKGSVNSGTGTFGPIPVSWTARTQQAVSATTPEEMLAAAQASCYCMALSHELTQKGHAPSRLNASAVVTFGPQEGGGWAVTTSKITVQGVVPGIDQKAFSEAAEAAAKGCPVSRALAGVKISLESAVLES
ncbi:MAG TPA: OsmC family peroxiredoxin [Chloroflexota bacterium]|nr:OsmC family peroxiredoxin [Chloroflexota bacterium]